MSGLHVSPLALVAALLGGAFLYALLKRLRGLLSQAPLGASRRKVIVRMRPLVEAFVFVGYVVLAVPFVFRGHPGFSAVVLAVMVAGFVLVAWFAIRDAVAGMFIKAGELCQLGDVVAVDDVRGKVRGLGFRVLALETEEGEEVFIPYTQLSKQSLVRTPVVDGAHRHTFEIAKPYGLDPLETKAAIHVLALTSHWAAVAREPEVELTEEGRFVVTIYALELDRIHDVEEHVRKGVEALLDEAKPSDE